MAWDGYMVYSINSVGLFFASTGMFFAVYLALLYK